LSDFTWPGDNKLALSIVINVEEGSEATLVDGDKGPEPVDELGIRLSHSMRNYSNESNYEYGLREGWPRIRDALERYRVQATFTAAAVSLMRAPDIARYIADSSHETCSHGWRWIHQFRMNEDEERDFIRKATRDIEKSTGKKPVGWLSRYLLTDNTRRLLQEEGYLYHMDDYSADAPFFSAVPGSDKPMLIVPYALDSNDMKFWTDPSLSVSAWLDYACRSFDILYEEGCNGRARMMSLGLHLRIMGRPGRIRALYDFLAHVHRHDKVWVTTREAIARHWQSIHPDPVARPGLRD